MNADCRVFALNADVENKGLFLCVGGRWDGWWMTRHADGQFVTLRKASEVAVEFGGDPPMLREKDPL